MTETVLAGWGAEMTHVPLWEALLILAIAAGVIAFALRGGPKHSIAHSPTTDDEAIAVISEVQGVDRGLSVHANGVLTLSIVAAGAFATIIQTNGGPGIPLLFATTIALITGVLIGTTAFALEGGPTAAAALPTAELIACAERQLRRGNRRLQCVRVATWCLIPIVLLVVIAIAQVRT